MKKNYLKVNQEYSVFLKSLRQFPQCDRKGVYKLFYQENGKPKTIKRLFSEDASGLLYIGMTEGPLIERVGNLQKALVSNWNAKEDGPASSGHTQMGKRYYRIRKKVHIDDLFIKIIPVDNPKQTESDYLEDYVSVFAELPPPLNGQYGSYDPDWGMFQ